MQVRCELDVAVTPQAEECAHKPRRQVLRLVMKHTSLAEGADLAQRDCAKGLVHVRIEVRLYQRQSLSSERPRYGRSRKQVLRRRHQPVLEHGRWLASVVPGNSEANQSIPGASRHWYRAL